MRSNHRRADEPVWAKVEGGTDLRCSLYGAEVRNPELPGSAEPEAQSGIEQGGRAEVSGVAAFGRPKFGFWTATLRLALLILAAVTTLAQTLPLELRQAAARYNFQSTNGVPISDVVGDPPGSDGRAPGSASGPIGTSGQFQTLLSFGGGVLGTNAPRGRFSVNPSEELVLSRARLGNPIVARSFALYFGDIIARPSTDEYGVDLNRTNLAVTPPRLPVLPSEYWRAEPFSTTGHTNAEYYWSIHAERVFATQPGPVTLVWLKSAPGAPRGNPVNVGITTNAYTGYTNTIYTNRYLVSSQPAKPPRRMYWTEGPFVQIGKPISIPTERVRDVNIVFNNRFPELTDLLPDGTNRWEWTPNDGTPAGPIAITNTLWFHRGVNEIHAYNLEGRVFVELLGDKRGTFAGGDVHQQLGYELVEVLQRPTPDDVTVELGELLTPFQADPPPGTPELRPDPLLTVGQSFAFRHSIAGTERFEYYAVRETKNQNDFQMHWLEEGLQGLLWPYRYVRYALPWPDEVSRYSHYVRPLVDSEEQARATAVPLPASNAPQIAYQDQDPNGRPRGKLTESFAYYTFLDTDYPAHRALLQFTAGEYVRFERVFSWLDAALRSGDQETGWPGFAGSVATDLGAWTPGFSLRLMTVDGLSELPNSESGLLVVARNLSADSTLHFKAFNREGQVVLDKPEGDFPDQSSARAELRGVLASLWEQPTLTRNQRDAILVAVAAITGQPLTSDGTFQWPGELVRPRVVTQSVNVGQRIGAPDGELGGGLDPNYLAGYIQPSQGKSYHPTAYLDPFASGFDLANQGAIIPVNAVPTQNQLEVWWFRKNTVALSRGFQPSYWPAVIGRYTIQWPTDGSEIILASNDGSGPLPSLEATGSLYYENDRGKAGYNPNEEHALMQGGQAFALRDDLNVTAPDPATYSSDPFVLLAYTEQDGRPAIRTFRVRREKPEAGITFEYTKPAGAILQAPMPLPLLGPAFAPKIPGQTRKGLNQELVSWRVNTSVTNAVTDPQPPLGELSMDWTLTTEGTHGFRPFWPLALQTNLTTNSLVTRWFYATAVTHDTLTGVASTNPPVPMLSLPDGEEQPEVETQWAFGTTNVSLPLGPALLALPSQGLSWNVIVTNVAEAGSTIVLDFGIPRPGEATTNGVENGVVLVPSITGLMDGAFDRWMLSWNELLHGGGDSARRQLYSEATVTDRKGNVWVYRGPHRDSRPESFTMRFYYNTLPGFFFPGLDVQPAPGTATPYLRHFDASTGQFVGDAVNGNRDGNQFADANALAITYHPVWPVSAPVLQMAETLTTPKRGLPAVRGQSSVEVLYQQSQVEPGANGQLIITDANRSVILHDPTREKTVEFNQADLPDSVNTETSRGKIFFPNLPPHLVKRFWLDPNRGAHGALVFAGEFMDAALGDDYLLLNVAGPSDVATLRGLCLAGDPKKDLWDDAVERLATVLEQFVENPGRPGTFLPFTPTSFPPGQTNVAGLTNVAAIYDDDVAVDSYALTATGPNTGYVSLIVGNGEAFTPADEPVTVHVLRVVPELYRGEVNVIASENPLNEKLTLQQVVDLGGQTDDYTFQWRITSPVDGQPPGIYTKEKLPAFLLAPWSHVRFPFPTEGAVGIEAMAANRVAQDITVGLGSSPMVAPVSEIRFTKVMEDGPRFRFIVPPTPPHRLAVGNHLVMSSAAGAQVHVTVHDLPADGTNVFVSVDPNQAVSLATNQIFRLSERVLDGMPQSIAFTRFVVPPDQNLTEVWLGLDQEEGLGAKIYVNGALVVSRGLGAEDTPANNPASALSEPRLARYFKLPASVLAGANVGSDGSRTHRLAVEFFSSAAPGALLDFEVRLEAFESFDQVTSDDSPWIALQPDEHPDGVRTVVGGTANVRSLSDNYLTMRYVLTSEMGETNRWSQWTEPQLAEGWIKRVLAGINPFNQRLTDLFNNSVSTDVSLIAQAGQRWEGDIALNLDSINDYGLIEIYETVLNRGRNLSIDGGINYGPANDALLLAAGYLNDLYMMLGNEAAADAANPTIGIGTADNTYGDIATALFSFKGQLPTLLEEELSLLRGRDDFLVPGVETRPVYNRMVWNYTRGIDAGEVIYALNYNILDQNTDGRVDAADAQRLFPQGHGDAYGHYLTALKGYYRLFLHPDFDWVPRSEAVLVLGRPVTVDYQDERKLAAAAGALARTGKQIFDLTWRKDYRSGAGNGWAHFRGSRESNKRTRSWGLDHWASRTGQGAYLNWIVGNAIVPETDPDPAHLDTIQQVDRTTVPELKELPAIVESLQVAMDNAESGLTPLGLPESTVPFDLNPNVVVNANNQTHFEQIYARAIAALDNAVVAFDDAKDVTRLMRSEEDSLADLRAAVEKQELAYTNALIELFGTPYPEDIGPGKTYRSGYTGPDLIHYSYVDNVELNFNDLLDPAADVTWRIDTQTFRANWLDGTNGVSTFLNFIQPARNGAVDGTPALEAWETNHTLWVEFNLSSHGFFEKPETWTGRRASPGKVQQAISDIVKARNAAYTAFYWADAAKYDLDWAIESLNRKIESHRRIRDYQITIAALEQTTATANLAYEISEKYFDKTKDLIKDMTDVTKDGLPLMYIAGLAVGGDLTSPMRSTVEKLGVTFKEVTEWKKVIAFSVVRALQYASESVKRNLELYGIGDEAWDQELRDATGAMRDTIYGMNNHFMTINARLQELDDAQRRYRALLAEGDRIQQEREIYRERTAAIIQGYRTRDAAFRIFRNEKLERYKTLFDLAAQYAFMAAKAYDYETGLLGTARGREFIQRIVHSRALGVVHDGEPQFAGSNTGDPGLSSVLAEMFADWSVVKGRLGFNNPDAYGTTVSLRYENFRISSTNVADPIWQNVLHAARRDNLLADPDVRRYCLQLDPGNGLPVPGLVFEFSTTIADGLNLFGRPIAGGDHRFPVSSFATKIFAAGVALEGYVGMADPAANSGLGGNSPPDPDLSFLDPDALVATPYLYLVPVGVDSMRSPPLGDASEVRTWTVEDVAVPLPFNLGGSDFSATRLWQSADSLTEELFAIRKHQAFRPVPSARAFSPSIYTSSGGLQRTQFTNNRLIGRSVWNSQWKLVIPGKELLANPNEGIERFLRTVRDIKLHFVTYSYSGN